MSWHAGGSVWGGNPRSAEDSRKSRAEEEKKRKEGQKKQMEKAKEEKAAAAERRRATLVATLTKAEKPMTPQAHTAFPLRVVYEVLSFVRTVILPLKDSDGRHFEATHKILEEEFAKETVVNAIVKKACAVAFLAAHPEYVDALHAELEGLAAFVALIAAQVEAIGNLIGDTKSTHLQIEKRRLDTSLAYLIGGVGGQPTVVWQMLVWAFPRRQEVRDFFTVLLRRRLPAKVVPVFCRELIMNMQELCEEYPLGGPSGPSVDEEGGNQLLGWILETMASMFWHPHQEKMAAFLDDNLKGNPSLENAILAALLHPASRAVAADLLLAIADHCDDEHTALEELFCRVIDVFNNYDCSDLSGSGTYVAILNKAIRHDAIRQYVASDKTAEHHLGKAVAACVCIGDRRIVAEKGSRLDKAQARQIGVPLLVTTVSDLLAFLGPHLPRKYRWWSANYNGKTLKDILEANAKQVELQEQNEDGDDQEDKDFDEEDDDGDEVYWDSDKKKLWLSMRRYLVDARIAAHEQEPSLPLCEELQHLFSVIADTFHEARRVPV